MKILYVTTIGSTMSFFRTFIKKLLDDGITVDIATNELIKDVPECYKDWNCKVYHIDTSRSPLNKGNILAIKQIKELVEQEQYDIVHCHTPIAAMCTRFACRKARKNGTKVIYTAHGFHFYKGAPLKNWLIFYPIEKLCACFTDVLITINQEDYALAQKKLKAKRIEYVPGVGIDTSKYFDVVVDKTSKREELAIPQNATLLISVGELNDNKNHETVIRALSQISDKNLYYIIAGIGNKKEDLERIAKECDVSDRVKLLGYRTDVIELYKCADVCVFPSFREGLSVALMEAMSCGLPCAVSKIRGNTDLIDENGGALFDPFSVEDCARAISDLLDDNISEKSEYNVNKVQQFSLGTVMAKMDEIYQSVLGE